MQSSKVQVCCSLSESRVTDPYFFDDDTVNGQNSHPMLKEFFVPKLKDEAKQALQFFNKIEHHLILAEIFVSISAKSLLIGGWEGVVPSDGHHIPVTCLC